VGLSKAALWLFLLVIVIEFPNVDQEHEHEHEHERRAEGVGFEPTRTFALPVFKTGAINHSTTPPPNSVEPYSDICQGGNKS
jgi:hypothetical protein